MIASGVVSQLKVSRQLCNTLKVDFGKYESGTRKLVFTNSRPTLGNMSVIYLGLSYLARDTGDNARISNSSQPT